MGPNHLYQHVNGSFYIISPCGMGCGPHWLKVDAERIAASWRCFNCQTHRDFSGCG